MRQQEPLHNGSQPLNAIEMPELLTARELEALLRIDVKTIYGYVQRGLIPYVRIQTNLRFWKKDILDWVARQSYPPHPTGKFRGKRHVVPAGSRKASGASP